MLKMRVVLSALLFGTALFFYINTAAQPTPSPSNQQATADNSQKHIQTDPNESLWDRTTNDPVALYTFVLTVFTGILATVSIFQWRALGRAENISRITASAAKKSADAAYSSTRPYVLLDGIHITRREFPGEPIKPNAWTTEVRFKNAGNTPAKIETVDVTLSPLEELSEVPDYGSAFKPMVVYTLTPNQTYTTQGIGPADTVATKNGKPVDFVIYGRIIYRDMSGNLCRTGFAQQISPHMPVCSGIKNEAYTYIE